MFCCTLNYLLGAGLSLVRPSMSPPPFPPIKSCTIGTVNLCKIRLLILETFKRKIFLGGFFSPIEVLKLLKNILIRCEIIFFLVIGHDENPKMSNFMLFLKVRCFSYKMHPFFM